jgi:DNA repair exonuclease SbcCD ATPase subunit
VSDKLLEHLIAQNDILLRHVLGDGASPAETVQVRELEEELAGVNRKLTEATQQLAREQEQGKEMRARLFRERDENTQQVNSLKTTLSLAESKVNSLATQLEQSRAELARAKQAGAPGELVDELNRLLGHAVKAFEDDDQDKLLRNLELALSKVTLTGGEEAA